MLSGSVSENLDSDDQVNGWSDSVSISDLPLRAVPRCATILSLTLCPSATFPRAVPRRATILSLTLSKAGIK